MKAAVYKKYGPPEVLRIESIQKPTLPKEEDDDIVLIKVHSASVNPFDYLHRSGFLPIRLSNGFSTPKTQVMGIDVAGTVEAVGKKVQRFKVGDAVFGICLGSHAEYVRAYESELSLMPNNLTFSEAAAVPTVALTALQALRNVAQIKAGDKVLINGASGGVGHFAVQFAKYYQAEVTAVCSTSNLNWVKNLGADYMIDYTKEDFTKNGKRYDIILDAVAKRTFFSCRRSLTKTGVYITENPLKPAYHPIQLLLGQFLGGKSGKAHMADPNEADLDFICELIEAENLKPVIEKRYPLEQIVGAHHHVQNGHTKGKDMKKSWLMSFKMDKTCNSLQTLSYLHDLK